MSDGEESGCVLTDCCCNGGRPRFLFFTTSAVLSLITLALYKQIDTQPTLMGQTHESFMLCSVSAMELVSRSVCNR